MDGATDAFVAYALDGMAAIWRERMEDEPAFSDEIARFRAALEATR